jgi:hypothetical protein
MYQNSFLKMCVIDAAQRIFFSIKDVSGEFARIERGPKHETHVVADFSLRTFSHYFFFLTNRMITPRYPNHFLDLPNTKS